MNFTKGVGVFIIKDGKILLLKRLREPFKNHWEVPAGKVDESEDLKDTVIREVREETGFIVEPEEEIGININEENKFESHMFKAKITNGNLKNNEPDKHSEIKFFPLNNLPKELGSTTQKGLKILKTTFTKKSA